MRGSVTAADITPSVNIYVRDLSQLFNSLDPSPFWDRDLDREAARFIEGEFSEKLPADTWNLYIHAHGGGTSPKDLQTALETYHGRMASSALEFQALLRGQPAEALGKIGKLLLHVGLTHDHAARGNGADSKLRMSRHADLAHDNDVERDVQRTRDLEGHGHAPTR